MKRLKAFNSLIQDTFAGIKLVVTGEYQALFEQYQSVDPTHIAVTEDPPLCRNCAIALLQPQDTSEVTEISRNFARLEASAKLGCYLCSLLYNGTWTPIDSQSSRLPLCQKLRDIIPPPELFSCSIESTKDRHGNYAAHFRVEAFAASIDDLRNAWQLKNIVLIPEEEMVGDMARPIEESNSPEAVAQQALLWIEECNTTHSKCQSVPPSTTWKPTRLIFTGKPDLGLMPRLCNSSDLPQNITYVTLSHCWGQIEIFRLLSTNLEKLLQELPLSELTQVFRDAIGLACRLGINYIWIDSLCIVQDSFEDWEHGSALMGNIYKYSWCNIAATGFENGLAGLYVSRNPEMLKFIKVDIEVRIPSEVSEEKICKGRFYCMENLCDVDVSKAPLNQRGWVYQERLLSPRVLQLTKRQVFWECLEMEACENFPNGLPAPLKCRFKSRMADLICTSRTSAPLLDLASCNSFHSNDPRNGSDAASSNFEIEMLDTWWHIVGGYNRGGLTRHEDKLIAISGLAKEIQAHLKDEYVAGLWKKHLLNHLTWLTAPSEADDSDYEWGQRPRPEEYQAPSWSWASINERVKLGVRLSAKPLSNIIDFNVTVTGPSEFSRVTAGYVRLRGWLSHATFQSSDRTLREKWQDIEVHKLKLKAGPSAYTLVLPILQPDVRVAVPNVLSDGFPSFPVRDAIGSRDFYLLPMFDTGLGSMGLILQRTKEGVRGEYERLGVFWLAREEESFEAFRSHVPFLDP